MTGINKMCWDKKKRKCIKCYQKKNLKSFANDSLICDNCIERNKSEIVTSDGFLFGCKFLNYCLFFLGLLDLGTTAYAYTNRLGWELNPLMDYLLSKHFLLWFIVKFLGVIAIFFILEFGLDHYKNDRSVIKFYCFALIIMFFMMFIVCVNNLSIIL